MRSRNYQADYVEEPSPWTRPGFVLAAALLLVIVALGVVVAVRSGDDDGPGPETPPVGAVSGTPAAQPQTTGELPTAVPTTAPAGVTWQVVRGTALPFSDRAGPRDHSDAQATGFAHTPEGALVAAAQLTSRVGAAAGRASWQPTLTRQFLPSPDRDRLQAALEAEPEQPAQPGDLAPLAGYLYQSYTPDTAVIGLVYRAVNGTTARWFVVTTTLQWRDDDWKMVAPPGGAWTSLSRTVTDLRGVVEWGAR
ncbi:hypothetical protein [Micromonospora maritima]|uniref:hypothetical protein n=1 Tax=Micromonospora maritima TaxID=986711 RepID=UPI00157D074B|nr:hypothetical protein [Micromonospora maritima]